MANYSMPLDKLLDLEIEKYQIARAAMQVIKDMAGLEKAKNIEKPAVYALAKILNQDYSYEVMAPKKAEKLEEEETEEI